MDRGANIVVANGVDLVTSYPDLPQARLFAAVRDAIEVSPLSINRDFAKLATETNS